MLERLDYAAPSSTRALIAQLGRTEDIAFSPDNRHLAIISFAREQVVVVDVTISDGARRRVVLDKSVAIASPALRAPHGVDFLGDDAIVVANRHGDVAVFAIPAMADEAGVRELMPARVWPAKATGMKMPGSVFVEARPDGAFDVLVCNNTAHTVTVHRAPGGSAVPTSNRVAIERLCTPDGVAASDDGELMAVSNHDSRHVLVFGHHDPPGASPRAILRGVYFPHGLRFAGADRFLLVADAGSPYVHVFERAGARWEGVLHPSASVPVLPADMPLENYDRGDRGPKGLDVDATGRVVAITCEQDPLGFFDLSGMLARPGERSGAPPSSKEEFAYELSGLEHLHEVMRRAREAQELNTYMRTSRSWRLTAPLRGWDPRKS
jgi:DNA-binding beta-propeller fold protein YncE